MAPDGKPDRDTKHDIKQANGADDTSAAEAALNRRIKCGEQRPVCQNCIKSKRHCEGYNQRVVFKPPTFDFRPAPHGGGAHITFQAGPVAGSIEPYGTGYVYPAVEYAAQSQIRPKPLEQFEPHPHQAGQQLNHPLPPSQPQYHREVSAGPQFVFEPPPAGGPPHATQQAHLPRHGFVASGMAAQQPLPATNIPLHHFQTHEFQVPSYNGQHLHNPPGSFNAPSQPMFDNATEHPTTTQRSMLQNEQWRDGQDTCIRKQEARSPTLSNAPTSETLSQGGSVQVTWQPSTAGAYIPRPELCRPLDQQPTISAHEYMSAQHSVSDAHFAQPVQHPTPDLWEHEVHIPPTESPTYVLTEAAVEVYDDDYYDIHSDDEMDFETTAPTINGTEGQHTLNTILGRNHITIQEMQTRRYDTFISNGMLDHYRVEEHANPLRHGPTARVFAHFISVTGPSLSIFERHPRNTSVLFTEGHIPFSQQGLWTYTMPMAALHNQGLLHAMLALASLHIARLTGASVTPSMHHYGWALKRVHHCVGHEKKRLKIATIAASMLLGFYEVMTADHMKWNTHLAGSKQLFVETDFVTMTQQFRRMKIERHHFGRRPSLLPLGPAQDDVLDQIPDVDERLVSILVGREVRYGDHGQIMTPQSSLPAQLDLGKFEILKDLYWWYCKQDVYQSIVSGNPLLMDFSRWANCPPRAPLGKPDAVYGSFDHLMLLLARIADFASRDRARKLKQIELNGGQWRPAAGMNIPRPPQQAPPPTPASARSVHSMHSSAVFPSPSPAPPPPGQAPMFYGMAPPPRQSVQMPSSYAPLHNMPTPVSATPYDTMDIHLATQAALKEHGEIRAALHTFSQCLGDFFQPLSSEYQTPMESPFGTALVYRTFDVACLWAVYHMALIIAIRSHPHMPPAAHMAAGAAAQETAHFAREIGRIAAGIVPGPPNQTLNPSLGAALCESCMPSFFAAVQYQDAHQRHATVDRIFNIAKRTGWGSAELIANGCETAWVKAAAAGRGPPYQRIVRDQGSDDPRLNGSWETLDRNAMPDGKDEGDRRLIRMRAAARLNWAIGIMGTEEDVAVPTG
ncbi:hypothetical protein LTR85_007445 [Meristemomyces frigidus]|nr:hypothetical protein LTR85_007445 [Meristemomyces frigidus]